MKIKNKNLKREFNRLLNLAFLLKGNGFAILLRRDKSELDNLPFVIDIEGQSFFYADEEDRDRDYEWVRKTFLSKGISYTKKQKS